MEFTVRYKESAEGNTVEERHSLTLPALIKHFGFAGFGYGKTIESLYRGMGAVMYYYNHFDLNLLTLRGFKKPPALISEPTALAQFSNVLGKAIGDFLVKKIYDVQVTVHYESEMVLRGLSVSGSRPDLYCISESEQFAVECKGFSRSSVSESDMEQYKNQSEQGPVEIQVNRSIASATYNIYDGLKNKFYDPVNPGAPYNSELNSSIIKEYYGIFFPLLSQASMTYRDQSNLEAVAVIDNIIPDFLPDYRISLLICKKIEECYKTGRLYKFSSFDSTHPKESYIDSDGIGIKLTKKTIVRQH